MNHQNDPSSHEFSGRERLLRAARREPVDRPPVWFMRQAGRYLPEYRERRAQGSFLEAVRDPETAAELTCQPVERFGLDAAIIFSDILVPPAAMGLEVRFEEGAGPRLEPLVRSRADVDRLDVFDPEEATGFVAEALRLVRRRIGEDVALIGFSGAPFTTASYMIEGRTSRNFENAKAMLHGDPETFAELLEKITDALVPYLGMQVEAGADVLQIFDSWGGSVDARTYREVLGPATERLICCAKATGVPVVLYVNGCAHLLEVLADLGPDVIGIDWRVDPVEARRRVGDRCALQGNLDPAALFAPPEVVARLTREVMRAFGDAPGHVFNLGSGILPGTPVESVESMLAAARERSGS